MSKSNSISESHPAKTIAVFSNSFWNLKNFRREIIENLHQLNYKITLIYPYDDDVHKLDFIQCKHIVLHEMKALSKSFWNDYRAYRELNQVFKKNKFDLVLSFTIKPNIYGSLIARKFKVPCISTVTGLGKEIIKGNTFSRILNYLYVRAVESNEYVIFHNEEDLLSFNGNDLHSNYKVIPGSGVNTEIYKKQIRENQKNEHNFVFLFSGRLIKSKGIIELLRAAKKVKEKYPHTEIRIVGKHTETELDVYELLIEYQEKKIVQYYGFIDHTHDILNDVDAVILPSYREGKSKSILEAMAMEIPVICSDVPGCHDLIKHDYNGMLCAVKDENSLADKMLDMINTSAEDRNKMGERSRLLVLENYDVNIITNKYLVLIHTIFNKNKK